MRPRVITWPTASFTAIAQLQSLGAAGNLLLNGDLNPLGPVVSRTTFTGTGIPLIVFPGYTRSITLTSLNNLSGVTFTIVGMFNNQQISETISGPNSNTVISANAYDSIIRISTNAAAAGVEAGTAWSMNPGRTSWINGDYDLNRVNYSVQVVVNGSINYTLFVTLDDPNTVATPTAFSPITTMTGATSNQFASFNFPINYMNITINSSNSNASLVATFLQQGIAP